MSNYLRKFVAACSIGSLTISTGALAGDYWLYTYIGNPATTVSTTNPNTVFEGGHVSVSFHSSVLLAANGTFSLLSSPQISDVIVNFSYSNLSNPEVSTTFVGYPDAQLDSFYSYVTIGADPYTITQWEIFKYFHPITDPDPGAVITAGYAPGYLGIKPPCVTDCSAFDRILLGNDSVWVTDNAGTWTVTLVPEPERYAMILASLGLLSVIARRKRKGPSSSA